jgi:tetratricopeptide (TPR) repeat protein
MRVEDAELHFDSGFREGVKAFGKTLTEAGQVIGHSVSYYSRLMTEEGGSLNWQQSTESLELMGHPLPLEVLFTSITEIDTDPALILLAAREQTKIAADLYFREARPRIEALIAAGPMPEGEWSSRAAKIKKLDKLRRRDRQAAKVKLQELINNALDRMEATGLRPRQAFVDLAAALGVLAALHRLAGRRNDAMDLLLVARPLSLLANDLVAEGEWFLKASFLLVDLGRNVRAIQFLLEAGALFFLGGAPARVAATLVARGYVLTHAGLHEASRKILEPVLPLLPQSDIEGRLSVHQTLARNFRELGNLSKACEHLAAAIELVGTDLLARASCLWSRAILLTRLGESSKALASFKEALPLLATLTGAAELAELSMEYAKLLLREQRRPELRALAADLSGWIQELRGNRKLRDIVDDFMAMIDLKKLNQESILELVARIQEVKLLGFPHTEMLSGS